MAYLTIPAYEASSPFIYVYYAEDDTRAAMPILARLYNEGLRMWSWNGSAQASDFRASQRINTCSALIIFLSENLNRAVDRGDFEAMAALRCNKVKYFVRLSDVKLPFDWGSSENNIVIDYVRSNEAAFWLSIYDSTIIEKCRGPWPEKQLSGKLPSIDAFDVTELDDEYKELSKIIDNVPRTDKYGAPVNAEDIELFAMSDSDKTEERINTFSEDERNRYRMDDLMDMLENISRSTMEKAQAIEQEKQRRMLEQAQTVQQSAPIPFEQQTAPLSAAPVGAFIGFMEASPFVERAAAEMFGERWLAELDEIKKEEKEEEIIPEEQPQAEEQPEEQESEQPQEPKQSFEEFIDELSGLPAAVKQTEETEPPREVKKRDIMFDIVLPDDDKVPDTVYVYDGGDEGEALPTPQELAEKAAQERRAFELAINKAAFKMTGTLVARVVDKPTVSLKVKEKKKKVKIEKRPKTVKPKKVTVTPVEEAAEVKSESRTEERRRRRMERKAAREREKEQASAAAAEEQQKRKFGKQAEEKSEVVTEPLPVEEETPKRKFAAVKPVEEPSEKPTEKAAEKVEDAAEEEAPKKRKKGFPHRFSATLEMLKEMKAAKRAEKAAEEMSQYDFDIDDNEENTDGDCDEASGL